MSQSDKAASNDKATTKLQAMTKRSALRDRRAPRVGDVLRRLYQGTFDFFREDGRKR